MKPRNPRLTTNRNVNLAREAIKANTGSLKMTETIWKSIRRRTIRLRVQQFLYKAIHNTLMIGEFWFNIEGYQHRGRCEPCATMENMDHILIHCRAGHTKRVWNLARKLWPYGDVLWPEISLGTILGSGCLAARKANGQENTQLTDNAAPQNPRGAAHLLQIIVSEAAHLAWVL